MGTNNAAVLTRLRRWLSPPVFPDEEKMRVASMVYVLLLLVIFVMILDAGVLLILAPETLPTFWMNGLIVLACLAFLGLVRRGNVRLACMLFCLLAWPLTVYYIAISGGLHSPALGFLSLFVGVGVILFGARGAIGFGLLDIAAIVGLYFTGSSGLLTPIESLPTLSRMLATNGIVYLLLAILMAIGGRSIQAALSRARLGERILGERNRELQREITERKQIEETLKQERKLLRIVIDHLPDNIFVKDRDGKFLLNNTESIRILGATRQEDLLGKSDFDFFPHEMAEQWRAEQHALMEAGQPILEVEESQPWQVDRRRWIVGSTIPLHDENGTVIGLVGLNRDITERKEAEAALRQSEKRFSAIFHTSPVAISLTRIRDGRFIDANDAFLSFSGYSRDELLNGSIGAGAVWVEPQQRASYEQNRSEQGGVRQLEFEFRRKSGEIGTALISSQQITLDNEACSITFTLDITERKRAEKALRQAEETFSKIFYASPIGATLTRASDGVRVAVNDSFLTTFGYMRESLLQNPPPAPELWADQAAYDAFLKMLRAQSPIRQLEFPFRKQSGETGTGLLSIERIELGGEPYNLSFVLDITERKQAEEALKQERNLLRIVIDNLPDNIYVKDRAGHFLVNNVVSMQLLGVSRQEDLFGKTDFDLMPRQSAEYFRAFEEQILNTGQPIIDQEDFQPEQTDKWRWLTFSTIPLHDKNGEVIGLVGRSTDITERKRAQEELRRRDLILEAVSAASDRLLRASDWQQEIHKVLEILGKADEADRAAIFQIYRDKQDVVRADLRYEWDAPGVSSHLNSPQLHDFDVAKSGLTDIWKQLMHNQPTQYHLRERPSETKRLIPDSRTLSTVHLPVFRQGTLWGALHLSTTRHEYEWSKPELEALQIAAVMLGTVMERKQSEDALQLYAKRLSILHQIDRAILAAESPRDIALAALHHIRELIPCQQTTIEIFGSDGKTLFRLAADSQGEAAESRGIDEHWIAAIKHGKALAIADLKTFPESWPALQDMRDRGFGSVVSLPLMVRGELLGALSLIAIEPGILSQDSVEIAGEIADQLAIAIQQARLFETERDQRTLAEALRDTAAALTSTLDTELVMARILDSVGQVVQHSAANIILIEGNAARAVYWQGYTDEYRNRTEPVALDIPILHKMIETGRPVFVPDTAADPEWRSWPETTWIRSYAAAPLRVRGLVIGFLNLDSATPGFFGAFHAERLQAFANVAAVGIENAQLYDELRRHAAELEQRVAERTRALQDSFAEVERAHRETAILYRVSRAVNATTAYVSILQALVDEVGAVDYNIALGIYPKYTFEGATFSQVMAFLGAGQSKAVEANQRMPLHLLEEYETGMIAIEDVDDPAQTRTDSGVFLQGLGIRALLSATIALGQREIGWFAFFSDKPRIFSDFERRIIRGMADLAAAAIERSRLFAEAQVAQKAAEDANRVKSQFLANMSHELRTPLNAILNFTAFVADGVFGPVNAEQAEALQQSVASGKHLLSLINDVLDLTKIEVGLMDLFIQEVDLNDALAVTISVAKGLVKDKPLQLVTEVEPHLPLIFGDKRRIRQIFLNLVSNGIKFTPQGRLTINAHREGDTVHIAISDTGIGIAPEDQHLIFESFKQAQHDLPDIVGTGLGLPISKFFVEAHGGTIWLESEVGKGSTFHVIFPIRTREEAEAANLRIAAKN